MTQITITPKTSYYAEGVELWDVRRICTEYGISQASVRVLSTKEGFPAPYALAQGGKAFYSARAIQLWAEGTTHVIKMLDKKRRGVGRPSKGARVYITAIKG